MRHGVKFLVNELLSNTTVNFGMHIFLDKPLQETFQICWVKNPQVRAGDKARLRSTSNNKICTTYKGGISHISKVHCVHSTKCPFALFMQFLFRPCLSSNKNIKIGEH